MTTLENLERITRIKRQEMDSIFQEVKANSKALDECRSPHDFSICIDRRTKEEVSNPTPHQRFGAKWKCSKCGGTVDSTTRIWYEKGISHASKILAVLMVLVLTGCAIPNGRIVSITQSVIGIKIGENPATQTPEVQIGFFRSTFQIVPVGTNGVVPKVNSSLSLTQKAFSTVIDEDFESGDAAVPIHPSVARLSVMARTNNVPELIKGD